VILNPRQYQIFGCVSNPRICCILCCICKAFVAFLNIYCQVKWRLGEYFEAFLENGFLKETRFLVINVNFCGSTLEKLAIVELKMLAINLYS
jgi:hypothetical protein